MEINIKKLVKQATIPRYAKVGDAGMDLVATSKEVNSDYGFIEYGTGLSIEIPEGYVGLIFPRSSISKSIYNLANSVGVIDSGYRGEIKVRFFLNSAGLTDIISNDASFDNKDYAVGDRIAQILIMPYPMVTFKEVDELSATDRGDGGFGSTNT